MIKNLLYSLFLHFLLLLAIYASFNLKNIEETKTSEIAVSLIAISGNEDANSTKPNAQKNPDNKISTPKTFAKKEKKSSQQLDKNQASQKTKKPIKSIIKPIASEKIQEFKQEEKGEEEINKTTEEKLINSNQDDQKKPSTEEDLDPKKNSEAEKSEENSATSESEDSANNLENLDLSIREKFNIQSQLKRCYARAIDEIKLSSKFKISVKVNLSEEGYIDSNLDDLIDKNLYNNPKDPNYKIAIDNIRRALDLCSPLRNLPLDKYNVWKEVIFEFGENDLPQKTN